ncbi:putative leucine-rich repeat protein (LRRP) [Trypanosoma rangeli]|uniref:Putative leucine-rich repeat protein (LRRP) n=1 Tax=Trypanosoma rangeli TaxID=5698 RepID=A0A422P0W8_TRYRA|nr:putative leucine-rich repeat protein (LRRP) [Trypanosoma rangeli]RNF11393.1 putative leucine-rich repeat protein (LRRP) [Trypanosoma rangeli]|eukprot:RNF11393.1 putative leucine-rich repeat protein (LRRP) [Trypanosoma rangeli]
MSEACEGDQLGVTPLPPKLQLPSSSTDNRVQGNAEPCQRQQQVDEDNTEVTRTRWEAAAAGARRPLRRYKKDITWRQPPRARTQRPLPQDCQDAPPPLEAPACVPLVQVQNVEFPASFFLDTSQGSPLNTKISLATHSLSPSDNFKDKSSKFVSVGGGGGGGLHDARVRPPPIVTSEDIMFRQSGRPRPSPESCVVHPQGFRILKNRSVVERSLRSYFRLPPAPCSRLVRDRLWTQRQLMAVEMKEDEEEAQFFANAVDAPHRQSHMLLDGYLLLCASGQAEPEAVEAVTLQSFHIVGAIEDDLAHFQSLRFLDLSENRLLLEHLLTLTGLEMLHLPYNKISSLAGIARVVMEQQIQPTNSSNVYIKRGDGVGVVDNATHDSKSIRNAAAYYAQKKTGTPPHPDDGLRWRTPVATSLNSGGATVDAAQVAGYYSPHHKTLGRPHQALECSLHDVLLPNLRALNLSFNKIPPADILHLSYFPFLEKLDLSGNDLRVLPEDLADLTSVTHFALERNHFRDGNIIFAALSTMPALTEVNLNHNELRHVPPLSVKNGRGLCFPSIEVIGLGHNHFAGARDVAALTELVRTLQQVMLAGNPIARKDKERSAAHSIFVQAVMNLYWEQAVARRSDNDEVNSSNHFDTDVPLEDVSQLQTPHQNECGVADEAEAAQSGYHQWSSLVESWQPPQVKSESKRSSPFITKLYESGDNDDSSDRRRLYTPNVSHSSAMPEENNGINNLFWYGDAEPLLVRGTRTKGSDHTLPKLPTPSLLRFVELVFDDTVIKKQKPGYFYSKWRQLAVEGETQRHMMTGVGQLSSLVHPKTGLVTVPNYAEFMDIYRLLEDPPLPRRGFGRRNYAAGRERKRKQRESIVVPQAAADDAGEEEEGRKSDEESEEAVATTPVDQQSTGTDEKYDTEDSQSEGSETPRDVVFMTGVALEDHRASHQKRLEKTTSRQAPAQETPVEDYSASVNEGAAPCPDTREDVQTRDVKRETDNTKRRQPPRCRERSPRNGKESQPTPGVVEPPSTNVRILMNELRRMLRRPLPSLPPVSTSQGAGRI